MKELTDIIHYTVAIAAVYEFDLTSVECQHFFKQIL
jgi:hypothetical protein